MKQALTKPAILIALFKVRNPSKLYSLLFISFISVPNVSPESFWDPVLIVPVPKF
jgi:hypothetical protein